MARPSRSRRYPAPELRALLQHSPGPSGNLLVDRLRHCLAEDPELLMMPGFFLAAASYLNTIHTDPEAAVSLMVRTKVCAGSSFPAGCSRIPARAPRLNNKVGKNLIERPSAGY